MHVSSWTPHSHPLTSVGELASNGGSMRLQHVRLRSLASLCSYQLRVPVPRNGTRFRSSHALIVPYRKNSIDKLFSTRAICLQVIVEMFIIASERNSTQIGLSQKKKKNVLAQAGKVRGRNLGFKELGAWVTAGSRNSTDVVRVLSLRLSAQLSSVLASPSGSLSLCCVRWLLAALVSCQPSNPRGKSLFVRSLK